MIETVPISSISLLKQYTMSSLSAVTKRVRSLSETSEKLEKLDKEDKEEEENLDLDLDEKLGQRRDTLASIDSGLGEELTDEVESETHEEADDNLLERIEDFEVESDGEDLRTDPETGLRLISLDEVRDHCTMEDGWMVLYDRVYQVSNLLRIHPGGEEVMAEYLGYDATIAFQGVGHSKAASRMLQPNLIGILPQEERLNFFL